MKRIDPESMAESQSALSTDLLDLAIRFRSRAAMLFVALTCFVPSVTFADSIASFESDLDQEEAHLEVYSFLNKFDRNNFFFEAETAGFKFLVTDHLTSPFDYNIYGGQISNRIERTVIRLEGDSGDVRTLARIFEQEEIIAAGSTVPNDPQLEPRALEPKSHILSQSMTWIAPWIGVLHASWNSPRLTSGQTWFRAIAYFLIDGIFAWAGGSRFWTEPFDSNRNGGNIAAMLVLPRIFASWDHANLIRGHNKIAEMGYTFYMD